MDFFKASHEPLAAALILGAAPGCLILVPLTITLLAGTELLVGGSRPLQKRCFYSISAGGINFSREEIA